ncbi:Hydroxymethylpyrimidine ABC transporter, ATPase component [Desulfovibrio sp. DV]|nr:Hydroxymethylpyrimidine ABC transporter, ATPase component [Desulfovibrio sp. DV]
MTMAATLTIRDLGKTYPATGGRPAVTVLDMDEPFSALDCQTRNRMQAFLIDVWAKRRDTILFVTHNIEEAALLSDRIVVMTPKPSRIEEIVPIDLPRPRQRTDAAVNALRSRIFETLGRLRREER